MPPRKSSRPALKPGAFTLIELLVSMTVLVIIVVLVSQLVNGATQVTVGSTKHLDADGQSRQVFERMTLDFAKMVRRQDADCIFAKLPLPGGGTNGHDDKMFFYSEVPAFLDGSPPPTPSKSPVALVGYRINAGFQLERLGKLLTWDGAPATGTSPGGIMFLSSPSSPTPLNPDPLSTLAGNWPNTIGAAGDSPPYSKTTDDTDYNVLAEQAFRLEVCYFLQPVTHKDPTSGNMENISKYSSLPIAAPEDVTNNLVATQAPTAANDTSQGYQAGSRWYDTADSRAYICTNNAAGAAAWKILGMKDVAGVVVAIAVLDGTSTRILPTTQVQLYSTQTVPSVLPNLTQLNSIFSDLQNDLTASDNTVPDLSLNPPRLMAEAWLNEINQAGFAQKAGVPQQVANQIRIYQRYIPLNSTP